jgi:hypothetical protein
MMPSKLSIMILIDEHLYPVFRSDISRVFFLEGSTKIDQQSAERKSFPPILQALRGVQPVVGPKFCVGDVLLSASMQAGGLLDTNAMCPHGQTAATCCVRHARYGN